MIQIKRIYDAPSKSDGFRILVDRLWPRGVSKEKARIDEWMREVAPSNELRQWYQHDPAKWLEFRKRFAQELKEPGRAVLFARLKKLAREQKTLTLVFASKEEKLNNAAALKEMLNAG